MNPDIIKYNIAYHLMNDHHYRMVLSKDQGSLWLIDPTRKQYRAIYMHLSNGMGLDDPTILNVVSRISMGAINTVTKLTIDDEITSSSSHVGLVNIQSDPLSVNDDGFSLCFVNWSQWVKESDGLTKKDIDAKIQGIVKKATRKALIQNLPKTTMVMILIMVILYLFTLYVDSKSGNNALSLVALGGLYKPLIMDDHQWFRLVTSIFLHGGLLHLLLNMTNFFTLGQLIEPCFKKKWQYIALLLAGGIFGNILALVNSANTVIIGFSGALFTLLGYYTVYAYEHHYFSNKIWRNNFIFTIIVNLYISFLPGISFQAHLGGLIVGLVYGVINGNTALFKKMRIHLIVCSMVLLAAVVYLLIINASAFVADPGMPVALNMLYDSLF